jgi:SWIM zinc finger
MSTTTATRKPRQRRQHERTVKVLAAPSIGDPRTFLCITQDGKASHYWIAPLAADFGKGFRFEKSEPNGEAYDVLLENEQDASCTCKGHTYGGYCKHVDCCRALVAAGKLS